MKNKKNDLLFFYAQTPVHCGSGSSLEVIDLPIQREKHTNYPIFQASSIKGTMRRFYDDDKTIEPIFGPESNAEYASCITFTDARILLFPVKSFKDVFVWITCPHVLRRLINDMKSIGLSYNTELPSSLADDEAIITGEIKRICHNNKLILDEYVFNPKSSQPVAEILDSISLPHKDDVMDKTAIISDDMFKYFVTAATDVVARTSIDKDTGVVKDGQLWYEEYLPSDSILYSIVFAENSRNDNSSNLDGDTVLVKIKQSITKIIQIGGNETIGKGIVHLFWNKEE